MYITRTITKHDNNSTLKILYVLLIVSSGLGLVSIGGWDFGHIRLWQVILFVFVLISFLKSCFDKRLGFVSSPTFLFVIGYILAACISGANAFHLELWLRRLVLILAMCMLFYVFSQISTLKEFELCLKVIILSGTFFALFGFVEILLFQKMPSVFRAIHFFDAGWQFVDKSNVSLGLFKMIPRAKGFFTEPNEFSEYLTLPFGFLLAVVFFRHQEMKRRLIYIIGIFIVFFAQLFSLSRGGLLAFFAQFLGLFLIKKVSSNSWAVSRKLIVSITLILFALIVGVSIYLGFSIMDLLDTALGRIVSTLSGGNWAYEIRLTTIRDGLVSAGLSFSNFLVGVGAGNLNASYVREATTTNQFVDVLVETGIIGLSFYVAIILSLLRASHKFMKNRLLSSNNPLFTVFVGAYLSLLGMLIGGMTYATHALFFFWLNAGLLLAVCKYGNRNLSRLEKEAIY